MSDSEILFQTQPQSDLGLITNVGLQVKGVPEVKPAYQWLLDEGTGTSIAECSDNSWNGAYYGNRDIVYSHATSQASRLELADSNSRIELPYDYHWFANEWTITFWVRPYSKTWKQQSSDTGPWSIPNPTDPLTPGTAPLLNNGVGTMGFGFSSAGTSTSLGDAVTFTEPFPNVGANARAGYATSSWDASTVGPGDPAGWTFVAIRKTYTGSQTYFTVAKDLRGSVADYMQTGNKTGNANWAQTTNSTFNLGRANNMAWADFRVYTRKLTDEQLKIIYTKKKMDIVDWTTKAANPLHYGLSDYNLGTGLARPDIIRNLQAIDANYKETGADAEIEFVNSPTVHTTGGPLPKHKRTWGRGYVELDYTNGEYINLKDVDLYIDGYPTGIPASPKKISLAFSQGTYVGLNLWIRLNQIGGGKTQFLWSGGNDAATGTRCPDVLFDHNGNLSFYLTGNPAGPGGVICNYADLPDPVKNGEWFMISVFYSTPRGIIAGPGGEDSLQFFINGEYLTRIVYSYTSTVLNNNPIDYLGRGRNRTNIQGNDNWSYLDGDLSNFCYLTCRGYSTDINYMRTPQSFYIASMSAGDNSYPPATDSWPNTKRPGTTGLYYGEMFTKPMYKLYQELM